MRLLFVAALASALAGAAAAPAGARVVVAPRVVGNASDTFRFTGVNMDFWPTTKPKWNGAGALIVDLTQPRLRTLARGLSGALLRLGGSPADFLLYDVSPDACSAENLNKTQPVPGAHYFCPIWDQTAGQCLTLARWRSLLEFAGDAGLSLVLDLNACWGRKSASGDMDWSNIDGLLNVTAAARGTWGGALWGVEFANEVYENINATVYGRSAARLRARLDALWAPPGPPAPRVMGPDAWENDLSKAYYTEMLAASGGALHAVTVHDYADDCCASVGGNVLNVTCLDALFDNPAFVRDIAAANGVATWNGEGALHAYSGVSGLTDTAVSTVYYLHALGSYAERGIGLFSRQTLIGGDYELVNRTTLAPTPDYYGLLLFRKLVGGAALATVAVAAPAGVRAHAFCALGAPGGVAVLLVNFAAAVGATVSIEWPTAPPSGAAAELYTLTGVAGWADGDGASGLFRAALNNETLVFDGGLPVLTGTSVGAAADVWLPAVSATFVVWAGAGVGACG